LVVFSGVCLAQSAGPPTAEPLQALLDRAAKGDVKAECALGGMYRDGQGVRQDYAEAVRWFRKAAGQGDAKAANDLGFLYDNSQGVAEDHAEAARWYRRAADQGNADAEFNLGSLYDTGQGVPQDHAEAARYHVVAWLQSVLRHPGAAQLAADAPLHDPRLVVPLLVRSGHVQERMWIAKQKLDHFAVDGCGLVGKI
jgi:hypothetical protein